MFVRLAILCALLIHAPLLLAHDAANYELQIQPLLENYCYDCHSGGANEGGMAFDAYPSTEGLLADKDHWGKVWENVLTGTMPPADMDQPNTGEIKQLSTWIAKSVFKYDYANPNPGRVTIRRLNREEYHYSVLDLLGIDFKVHEHFPADDTGYGFDTVGDVLAVPPPLMEKYFTAAEQIADRQIEELKNPESAAYKRVFIDGDPPEEITEQLIYARKIISRISKRAFRRPAGEEMVGRLLAIVRECLEEGASFPASLSRAITAVLVSPQFIFRVEHPPEETEEEFFLLDEYALASRLSFFLWSSIPDHQLLQLTSETQLRANLETEVKRMLSDPKSDRFVQNFVGQWLRTREVVGIAKDRKLQQQLGNIRGDMCRETELLFKHIMREDLDVLEMITADYSFLNDRLAKFYGVPDVEGKKMRLVKLPEYNPRGGVLTHGSFLIVTSNPNRTSPVKRGRFILENILGTPSPPAPPDVPDLEDVTRGVSWHMSMREQLALHREDPNCASCHDRMDPLGLGLENFDSIGLWRDTDDGFPIDASGELVSGEEFTGVEQLRDIIATKKRLYYRCLTRKLMIYALGRGIEYTDTPVIEEIVDRLIEQEGQFSTLLMGIIESPQFQKQQSHRTYD